MMTRYYVMVLHRYNGSVNQVMPDRLRNVLMESAITNQEMAVELDTRAELAPWRWYSGAYNQYQASFMLLGEIHVIPEMKEADRIWACLDFVFETEVSVPRERKSRNLMIAIQKKIAAYQIVRGLHSPPSMATWEYLGQRLDVQMRSASQVVTPSGPVKVSTDTPEDVETTKPSLTSNHSNTRKATWPLSHVIISDGQMDISSAGTMQDDFGASVNSTVDVTVADFSQDDPFRDIDWDEWDRIFPIETNIEGIE